LIGAKAASIPVDISTATDIDLIASDQVAAGIARPVATESAICAIKAIKNTG
jgi:hypothetical protein